MSALLETTARCPDTQRLLALLPTEIHTSMYHPQVSVIESVLSPAASVYVELNRHEFLSISTAHDRLLQHPEQQIMMFLSFRGSPTNTLRLNKYTVHALR